MRSARRRKADGISPLAGPVKSGSSVETASPEDVASSSAVPCRNLLGDPGAFRTSDTMGVKYERRPLLRGRHDARGPASSSICHGHPRELQMMCVCVCVVAVCLSEERRISCVSVQEVFFGVGGHASENHLCAPTR